MGATLRLFIARFGHENADAARRVERAEFSGGKLVPLRVGGRFAYLIRPTAPLDHAKRWVWIFPFEHGMASPGGHVEYRFYIDRLLAAGFCVAGVDVGVLWGSRMRDGAVRGLLPAAGREVRAQFPRAAVGPEQWRTDCVCVGLSPSSIRRPHRRHLPGDGFHHMARPAELDRVSHGKGWASTWRKTNWPLG